jgi:hypothetical protein
MRWGKVPDSDAVRADQRILLFLQLLLDPAADADLAILELPFRLLARPPVERSGAARAG